MKTNPPYRIFYCTCFKSYRPLHEPYANSYWFIPENTHLPIGEQQQETVEKKKIHQHAHRLDLTDYMHVASPCPFFFIFAFFPSVIFSRFQYVCCLPLAGTGSFCGTPNSTSDDCWYKLGMSAVHRIVSPLCMVCDTPWKCVFCKLTLNVMLDITKLSLVWM